jgi:DNA-binding HxlR family transcriptional regulator
MDLIGQRWSMLVIRELTPGPRRFNDLHAGLPGLATDVLAERLRELVGAGVVEHRSVQHPVGAKVYALTASGVALAAIGQQLADWGRPLLPDVPADGVVVRARWALQTMALAYRGGLADGAYDVVIDDEELNVVIEGDRAAVRYGPAPNGAIVRVSCTSKQFFTAAKAPSWLERPHRGVEIDGDVAVAVALFAALPLHVGAAVAAAD